MKTTAIAAIALLLGVAASAQSGSSLDDLPPLTRTTDIAPEDSALVRAAKRAVAARRDPRNRRVVELTDTLSRGRYAEASSNPNIKIPTTSGSSGTPIFTSTPSEAEQRDAARQQQLKERMKKLEQERERMAAEAEEPYGGDISEDAVEQRQTAIPTEIEETQRQMNPPPPQ